MFKKIIETKRESFFWWIVTTYYFLGIPIYIKKEQLIK